MYLVVQSDSDVTQEDAYSIQSPYVKEDGLATICM